MEFWQQLLAIILTPVLVVSAMTWLMHKIIEHGFQRNIESFKSQLERESFEYRTKYSFIHQKRADIISGFYSRLARAKAHLGYLVAIFQPGGQSLPEKIKATMEVYNDANSYFFENQIFIPESTSLKVEEVLNAMRDAFYNFQAAQLGNEEYKPDKTGLWIKSFEIVKDKLPPILSELDKQFRETLGIIEDKP